MVLFLCHESPHGQDNLYYSYMQESTVDLKETAVSINRTEFS